jgi:hypothetical protein
VTVTPPPVELLCPEKVSAAAVPVTGSVQTIATLPGKSGEHRVALTVPFSTLDSTQLVRGLPPPVKPLRIVTRNGITKDPACVETMTGSSVGRGASPGVIDLSSVSGPKVPVNSGLSLFEGKFLYPMRRSMVADARPPRQIGRALNGFGHRWSM